MSARPRSTLILALMLVVAGALGCVATGDSTGSEEGPHARGGGGVDDDPETARSTPGAVRSPPVTVSESERRTAASTAADPRPEWLGTRVLPLRDDGLGEVQPTPPELEDRRLVTPDHLPPPEDDAYAATVAAIPDDVLDRSTWHSDCPVGRAELRYLTMSFWGFDGLHHTGEMIVNADFADDVVEVFRRLHEARFPIEEMRVVAAEELDAPPTGDGNNTTGFVCRSTVSGTTWSEHAHGRAVDINPFHNPYLRGDVVVPELASAYLDRGWDRPGMIHAGDVVTRAFAEIGWAWGGDWTSAKDWMHFSASGR